MTKQEWIARCADRYIERGDLDELTAIDAADACYVSQKEDTVEFGSFMSPEDAADQDMSLWDNDEAEA